LAAYIVKSSDCKSHECCDDFLFLAGTAVLSFIAQAGISDFTPHLFTIALAICYLFEILKTLKIYLFMVMYCLFSATAIIVWATLKIARIFGSIKLEGQEPIIKKNYTHRKNIMQT
jgi:hypothetical protein